MGKPGGRRGNVVPGVKFVDIGLREEVAGAELEGRGDFRIGFGVMGEV